MEFYSQLGQDRFLFRNFFRNKRQGTYVEIGAYDGQKFSNTLFFEQYLDWQGICIEPLPDIFHRLNENRSAICINCCIADFEGEADFLNTRVQVDEQMLSGLIDNYDERHIQRINSYMLEQEVIKVKVRTLNNVLREHNIHKIDYCSIDAEGSELKILETFDFEEFDVTFFSIENNYNSDKIRQVMVDRGYKLIHTFEGYDELYQKVGTPRLETVTIICSVWHGDPNKHELLAGHALNLDAQTIPVERVYVFDNGDKPPENLKGTVLTSYQKLSIYEAWNLALTMVRTPYVMNLNLDDRLAPDAIEQLEQVMMNQGADLVGGDWRICYSQSETDAVTPCIPSESLPFLPDWPPTPGSSSRLGSSTGERDTFGPACLWSMSLHEEFSRYPWQFGDGTLIRVMSDAIWWGVLQQYGKQLVRYPWIIGNYHSHPSEQAEFRHSVAGEEELLFRCGITLVQL